MGQYLAILSDITETCGSSETARRCSHIESKVIPLLNLATRVTQNNIFVIGKIGIKLVEILLDYYKKSNSKGLQILVFKQVRLSDCFFSD